MKGKTKMMIAAVVVIMAGIYYYAAIPAINIHSSETWFFIMIFLVILAVLYLGRKKMNRYEIKENKVVKGFLGVVVVLGVVYLLGTLLSSPVVNAKKYQKLMTVKEGEFAKDVEELSFDKIPLLDKDTAALLGDRKMGSMVDMVSQFEADDIYRESGTCYPVKIRKSDQMVYESGGRNSGVYPDQYGKSVYGACKTETGYEIYNK